MVKNSKKELNLRLANLALAIILSTVPTAITFGILGAHGINICRNIPATDVTKVIKSQKDLKEVCIKTSWDTTRSYILLIGFFITLPTWYWFYMSMKLKRRG